jgi:hypothetical protein
MKSLEANETRQPVRCRTASGDFRRMVSQRPHDAQAERSGQRRRRWKPGFVAAALPLALLFAYGFVRLMLERVFPVGATRH